MSQDSVSRCAGIEEQISGNILGKCLGLGYTFLGTEKNPNIINWLNTRFSSPVTFLISDLE